MLNLLMMKKIFKLLTFSDWKDLKVYYESNSYKWFCVQTRVRGDGKRYFRTTKIAGGFREYADNLRIDVEDLTNQP
jgi:hypothetical protein